MRDEDLALLQRLVAALRALDVDEDNEVEMATSQKRHLETFEDMADRLRKRRLHILSDNQRRFARDVLEKTTGEVTYENAWSAGKVPRGRVGRSAVPEVLRKPLPLKPPGRTG